MTREFSYIEINIVRNEKWLEPHRKQGFFLSPYFPLADFEIPKQFKDAGEENLQSIKKWLLPKIKRFLKEKPWEGEKEEST